MENWWKLVEKNWTLFTGMTYFLSLGTALISKPRQATPWQAWQLRVPWLKGCASTLKLWQGKPFGNSAADVGKNGMFVFIGNRARLLQKKLARSLGRLTYVLGKSGRLLEKSAGFVGKLARFLERTGSKSWSGFKSIWNCV